MNLAEDAKHTKKNKQTRNPTIFPRPPKSTPEVLFSKRGHAKVCFRTTYKRQLFLGRDFDTCVGLDVRIIVCAEVPWKFVAQKRGL